MATQRVYGENVYPPTNTEALKEFLDEQFIDLKGQRDKDVAAIVALPAAIESPEDLAKYAEALADAASTLTNFEATRVAAKEPYRTSGALVDGFFNTTLAKPVQDVLRPAKAELDRYNAAERARKVAEARAREDAARAEQERLRKEAERQKREEARAAAPADAPAAPQSAILEQQAQAAGTFAEQQHAVVTAKAAEHVRTRTEQGTLVTAREDWKHEVTNLEIVPRQFLTFNEPAFRAYLAQQRKQGVKADQVKVRGVRVWVEITSQVRR